MIKALYINYIMTVIQKSCIKHLTIVPMVLCATDYSLGSFENLSLTTTALLEELVRKGIGLLILALLTSFLISAVIHYLQVSLKT